MHLLEINGIRKNRGADFALGPVSLRLRPGEILGIMGPNGAGKTTLLRLIWGFIRPDCGTISALGLAPHLEQIRFRRRAGFVGDTTHFYDWMTVDRYLGFVAGFYPGFDNGRSSELLDRLGLSASARIDGLSRGARVKLGLIAAIAHRPELLILDETTSGLDPLVRTEVLGILGEMAAKGTGIILSSHLSNDLDRIADSVLMLEGGRVIEYAPAEALLGKYKHAQLEEVFVSAIRRVSAARVSPGL